MRSVQVALAFAPLLALAQSNEVTLTPETIPTATGTGSGSDYTLGSGEEITVSDFLFQFYGTATPAGATGAIATSLASALYA